MTHPTAAPAVQATTTIPSVPHVWGVYAVLQALGAGDPLMGGWGYLTWTGEVYHEALDLNSMGGGDADLGAAVVAPLDATVTDVLWWDGSAGFGNHLVLFVDDPRAAAPCFVHLAHLQDMCVWPGQRVAAGQLVATCGKSGLQLYAHVHGAWWKEPPPGNDWDFWQTGKSKDWVAQRTLEPGDWFWGSVAKAQGASPPEVEMILSGAQSAAVQAVVWGDHWNPDAADHAIPTSWREEWRRGVWRGAPLAAEQLVPEDTAEGKPGGSWMLFEYGCCVWLPGSPPSWNG